MAYNQDLADKIREAMVDRGLTDIEEKKMFNGICFMVNGKMCVCANKDEMLCRIGPEYKEALELNGVSGMIRNDKPLRDYVFVSDEAREQKRSLTIG